tara:strand:+ start:471 stop:2204 length:1734 start_codon:yes stop_codon:yes gene_type:complete
MSGISKNIIKIEDGSIKIYPSGSDSVMALPGVVKSPMTWSISASSNTNGWLDTTVDGEYPNWITLHPPQGKALNVTLLFLSSSRTSLPSPAELDPAMYSGSITPGKQFMTIITCSVAKNMTIGQVGYVIATALNTVGTECSNSAVAAGSLTNDDVLRPGIELAYFSASYSTAGMRAGEIVGGRLNVNWDYASGHYGKTTASMFLTKPSFTSSAAPASFSLQVWNTGSGYGDEFHPDNTPFFQGADNEPNQGTEVMAFQIDPDDAQSFMITGSSDNLIYFSGSGKLGINTKDPKRAFDLVDKSDGVAEFVIKRDMSAAGDAAGGYTEGSEIAKIKFIADSGSYRTEVSGTAAEIVASVGSVVNGNINGKLNINTFRSLGSEPTPIMEMGYGIATNSIGGNGMIIHSNFSQSGEGGGSSFRVNDLHARTYSMSAANEIKWGYDVDGHSYVARGTGNAVGGSTGDVLRIGNNATTAGKIYYLNNGAWALANSGSAATAKNLLGVAMGNNSSVKGMLLRGLVKLADNPTGTIGLPVYLAAPGKAHVTPTATAGDIARVIGYNVSSSNEIWFDPDKTWVEKS